MESDTVKCDWPAYPESDTYEATNEYASMMQDAAKACNKRMESE